MSITKKLPIHIIGTSHIASESVKKINEEFSSFQPDIVGIELDKQRFASLFSNPKNASKVSLFSLIKQFGTVGGLFLFIGQKMQKRLGKIVNMVPGDDMRTAAKLAQENKKQIALIDVPIEKTVKNLSKQLTFKEKMRFIGEILFTPFVLLFVGFMSLFPGYKKRQQKKRSKHSFSLSSVPSEDIITTLLVQLKKKYPTFYKVLLDDRNKYMAKQVVILHKKNLNKKILVVVGAGHKKEMENYLFTFMKTIDLV